MSFNIRNSPITIYRTFFVSLMLLIGLGCLSTLLLELYADVSILPMETLSDYEALIVTCGVTGMSSTVCGLLMLLLMLDRRTIQADRRQRHRNIDFPDRRLRKDRRDRD